MSTVPREAPDRVLSTMNKDGSRRWLKPRLSHGRYLTRRRGVGWFLMALFIAIPHLTLNGKPLILLDLPRREFTLFGATFLATDTIFLMLLLVAIFITVFLLTALFGRVWCGWACPQTVYMEMVFRPLERLIEGGRRGDPPLGRRLLKWAVFLLVSLALAHTFLAYFVGVDALSEWVRRSPFEHPASFLVMASVTGLVLFDFGVFREQTCTIACPYGRFQSVLLDRRSVIVGYDTRRGEPRGKVGASGAGDCVDCGACVTTCPTGIDIRNGLQMECIHCTQCIDACDAIMDRLKRPRGLIRYSSQAELAGEPRRLLRVRTIFYPAILLVVVAALVVVVLTRQSADVTVLRDTGAPFTTLTTGEISNALRIKVTNRSDGARDYRIEVSGIEGAQLVAPDNPIALDAGRTATSNVFVVAPAEAFAGRGSRDVTIRVTDDRDFDDERTFRLLGPASPGGGPQ